MLLTPLILAIRNQVRAGQKEEFWGTDGCEGNDRERHADMEASYSYCPQKLFTSSFNIIIKIPYIIKPVNNNSRSLH